MKKVIIYLGLITLITSLGGVIVGAEDTTDEQPVDITDEQPVDITTRARVIPYRFNSKPPKTYKGLTLISEKK